jgi:hypothetical protein
VDEHHPKPHLPEAERRVIRAHSAARMHPVVPHKGHRPSWKRWSVIGAGWFFVVLGILGMFLPILQGFLFLAVGIALLAREIPWVRRRRERLYARYPKLGAWNDKAEHWVERQGRRVVAFFRGRA